RRLNSQKQGGIGLGLTLAHSIVSAHGGEIRVKSKVGKGSTFTITFPVPIVGEISGVNGQDGPVSDIEVAS
ncbi:ATP-binding protein, partial [bacterium]|nr:ATP-binding protein [bacterium]